MPFAISVNIAGCFRFDSYFSFYNDEAPGLNRVFYKHQEQVELKY
jgi:hypothetical protein